MPQPQIFIDNRWQPCATGLSLPVIDPSDGQEFARIARGTGEDIDRAIRAARRAFEGAWGSMAPVERGRTLMRVQRLILDHAEELTSIEARDCGKPVKQAKNDVIACARYFEFYAGAVDKVGGQTIPYQPGFTALTLREPHGVTGHIIPWNYPLQVFGRSVGGALAAGNACVMKPAEDACLSLLRLAELMAEAGLPPGAINIVPGLGSEAGAALAGHAGIDHVSFTGSPETGTRVAQAAAIHHHPVTLELGGKSPQIVFADADLDTAVPAIVNAVVQNAGQTCSAGSRLLVERGVCDRLLEKLAAAFARLRVGPSQADLDCGPLIRAGQLERVRGFLAEASRDSLPCVAQGEIAADAPKGGYYQRPTLLTDVPISHRLAQEEVFGPVLACMAFDDEAHAVKLANATRFGLVAGVWTNDGSRQLRVARSLDAGQVFINNYGAGGGIELPFGGVKASGYGREKGIEGLLSFTRVKTITIRHG
jgi:aldehyde dehydrogenase (NAD+)